MRKAIFGSLGSAFAAACCAGVPAVIGAVLMVVGIFLQSLLYVGAAAMIGASIWNALALRRLKQGRSER